MSMLASCRYPLRHLGYTLLFCGLAPVLINAQEPTSAQEPTRQSAGRDAAVLTLSGWSAADINGASQGVEDVRDPQYQGVNFYSGLGAALSIDPQQERFHWHVNASTGVRHYASLNEFLPSGQNVGGNLSFSLGGRTTVLMSGSATYSPTYTLAPFLPALPTAPGESLANLDYGVVRSPNYSTATYFSLSQALTNRASVTLGYGMSDVRFTNTAEPSLKNRNAQARFVYRLTKYANFHAGYGRRLGNYDLAPYDGGSVLQEARLEDYDIGVDYSQALSLRPSRKTTLNFQTGSSIYKDFYGRHFYATGSALLDHRIARTGHVGFAYTRGVGFLQGMIEPVFSDSFNATASTALSRRVRVSSTVAYVLGSVGLSDGANNYSAWTGNGQFIVALAPRLGLQAGYAYYQHDVGDAVYLIGHVPNQQHRQTLFVGISYGIPLVRERVRTRR